MGGRVGSDHILHRHAQEADGGRESEQAIPERGRGLSHREHLHLPVFDYMGTVPGKVRCAPVMLCVKPSSWAPASKPCATIIDPRLLRSPLFPGF
jgi:hypothetical protein